MYLNYGNYKDDRSTGYLNKHIPLQINSCGMYTLDSNDRMKTSRPNGRMDFQMIYIHSGCGIFSCGNKYLKIEAGHTVFYFPFEKQEYFYSGNEHPVIYWIHFTGSEIESFLKQMNINRKHPVNYVGRHKLYVQIFNQIISELQIKNKLYEKEVSALFLHLLILMERKLSDSTTPLENEMQAAAAYFHENYSEILSIDRYIKENGYKRNSFFRDFKKEIGFSPLRYLSNIRIENAKQMLIYTDLSIASIAEEIGYTNPLYFSKIFHKYTGVSPSLYRTENRK